MPSERHTRFKDTNKQEVKRQKNLYYANSIQKRAGVAIRVSDKIDLKTKFVPRDKKRGGRVIRETIHQEYKTMINTMHLTTESPKHEIRYTN